MASSMVHYNKRATANSYSTRHSMVMQILLLTPFSKWLFGYDSLQEVDKVWNIYKKGEWPLTRGMLQTGGHT